MHYYSKSSLSKNIIFSKNSLEDDIYQYVVRDAINYVKSSWSENDDPALWCEDINSIIKELNAFKNLLLEEIESNK